MCRTPCQMNAHLSIFSLLSFLVTSSGKVCETKICAVLANEIKLLIDSTVNPCDDFSSYVCGNMDKYFSLQPGQTILNDFIQVSESIITELKEQLEKQLLQNKSTPQFKAAIFYNSCLKSNKKQTNPSILKYLNLLPPENEYEDNLSYLLRSGIATRLVSLEAIEDPINPLRYILYIGRPSIIMTEEVLQSNQINTEQEKIIEYLRFMRNESDALGIWHDTRELLDEVIVLNHRLIKILARTDQDNPKGYNFRLNIKTLQSKCPEISWLVLLNKILNNTGQQLEENDNILMFSVTYIEYLCEFIKEYLYDSERKKILQMDLEWAAIHEIRLLVSKSTEEVPGESSEKPQKICTTETSEALPELVGYIYVKNIFNDSLKNEVWTLLESIKLSLIEIFEKNTWMDTSTKNAVITKVREMTSSIGYPDSMLSEEYLAEKYTKLIIVEDNYLENYIKSKAFKFKETMKKINQKISADAWKVNVQQITANYNPFSNNILISAAILRYPFYDVNLPVTYNYGHFGMALGHEIMHGFDTIGSQFDEKGFIRDTWTKSSREFFQSKTNCIRNQYEKYSIYNVTLMPNNSINEDIADNFGIQIAFMALNSERFVREKLTLPGLDFTADQLFFIGEAKTWCAITNKRSILSSIKHDRHTIWKYRINGPLSNMPEFSKAFNCEKNHKMNPHKKCLILE